MNPKIRLECASKPFFSSVTIGLKIESLHRQGEQHVCPVEKYIQVTVEVKDP
jgi:hypothetical protein